MTNFSIYNFRGNKAFFSIYCQFANIYSNVMAFLENIFLRSNYYDKEFLRKGIFRLSVKKNFQEILLKYKEPPINKKSSVLAISDEKIQSFLSEIFDHDLRSEITKKTGFKFSIDYFRVYERKNEDKSTAIPHFDKSFSRNMLKIFIPIDTCAKSGPLKVFDKQSSLMYKKGIPIDKLENTLLIGMGEFIYGVNPNDCFHHEGNPEKDYLPIQMMFQLNPSKKWVFRKDLNQRQFKNENKFTALTSLFSKVNRL